VEGSVGCPAEQAARIEMSKAGRIRRRARRRASLYVYVIRPTPVAGEKSKAASPGLSWRRIPTLAARPA
jgi:hypothetical protein